MSANDHTGGVLGKWLRRWFGWNKTRHRKTNAFWEDRRPLKEGLKDIFDLHRSERNGFVIVSIGLVLFAGWVTYKQWFRDPDTVDLGAMKAQVAAFIAEEQQYASRRNTQLKVDDLKPFDPNDLDQAGWMALGLSERQAQGIMRYVDRGGRFRSKRDIGKMYTITPEQFAQLSPFILLPDSAPAYGGHGEHRDRSKDRPRWERSDSALRQHTAYPTRREIVVVEVNTADTLQLVELPGIGPAFARGIVKYRDKLGGYVSLDQLAEVFVLKDKPDAVARLKELLVLDASMVRHININTCTAEELTEHPYMWKKWSIARAIIAYRTQHGPFATVEAVKQCAVVDDDLYRQISPYLTVGEP